MKKQSSPSSVTRRPSLEVGFNLSFLDQIDWEKVLSEGGEATVRNVTTDQVQELRRYRHVQDVNLRISFDGSTLNIKRPTGVHNAPGSAIAAAIGSYETSVIGGPPIGFNSGTETIRILGGPQNAFEPDEVLTVPGRHSPNLVVETLYRNRLGPDGGIPAFFVRLADYFRVTNDVLVVIGFIIIDHGPPAQFQMACVIYLRDHFFQTGLPIPNGLRSFGTVNLNALNTGRIHHAMSTIAAFPLDFDPGFNVNGARNAAVNFPVTGTVCNIANSAHPDYIISIPIDLILAIDNIGYHLFLDPPRAAEVVAQGGRQVNRLARLALLPMPVALEGWPPAGFDNANQAGAPGNILHLIHPFDFLPNPIPGDRPLPPVGAVGVVDVPLRVSLYAVQQNAINHFRP